MLAGQTTTSVAESLTRAPIIGVVRTDSLDEARRQAQALVAGGLELVEITFTVPGASSLVRELRAARGAALRPWIGMGSVTTPERAAEAVFVESDFIVSPNAAPEVAEVAKREGRFLVLGALTPTEIVAASRLGADLVKVYPLPPVGGPAYLKTIRGPLWDIDMLAAGGFGVDEIPAYRAAGARAFGMAAPALLATAASPADAIDHALALARGER
jgi:2-dehydro-3-deoxyphosphogluconate aldolase / (4S)-4-hydroxy-2-oxoglutarate aldolase